MWCKDGKKFTDNEIRQAHPNTSFPIPMELHHIQDFGYSEFVRTPQPLVGPYEYAEEDLLVTKEGGLIQSWVVKQHGPEKIEQILVSAVQNLLDFEAQKYGYDDIKSVVTYAEEPEVEKFQLEGLAFRKWRSQVWAACYAIMGDVLAGKRAVPTVEELVKELPILTVTNK